VYFTCRYGRYENNREASGRTAGAVAMAGAVVVGAEAASLIDLSDAAAGDTDEHLNSKLAALSESITFLVLLNGQHSRQNFIT
jgi:hypothetical protein